MSGKSSPVSGSTARIVRHLGPIDRVRFSNFAINGRHSLLDQSQATAPLQAVEIELSNVVGDNFTTGCALRNNMTMRSASPLTPIDGGIPVSSMCGGYTAAPVVDFSGHLVNASGQKCLRISTNGVIYVNGITTPNDVINHQTMREGDVVYNVNGAARPGTGAVACDGKDWRRLVRNTLADPAHANLTYSCLNSTVFDVGPLTLNVAVAALTNYPPPGLSAGNRFKPIWIQHLQMCKQYACR